jgi:hypothetical protein
MRAWGGVVGSVLTLAVLIWRLGTGPFLDGLRSVDGGALAAGAGITVLTTACYAWRWKIVARGLGVDLSLPAAVAAYYRSLFLNVTLPGGIVPCAPPVTRSWWARRRCDRADLPGARRAEPERVCIDLHGLTLPDLGVNGSLRAKPARSSGPLHRLVGREQTERPSA